MDSVAWNRFDILEIYRHYCDIRSGNVYTCGKEGYRQDDESRKAKFLKEALAQLSKSVESRVHGRILIFDELFKLMSKLDLMIDFSEFSRFYDFVFFMCRENGQKNISVSRAVTAWRLVLAGRFRLLNQWCDFVEPHNISEDTWEQVLSFSRCVHANLEGYDPEGAWPVLIDDFVEHLYSISGSNHNPNFFCNHGESEAQSADTLHGLRFFPDLKRKLPDDFQVPMVTSDTNCPDTTGCKRSRHTAHKTGNWEDNPPGPTAADDSMDIVKHNSTLCSSNSLCAIEGKVLCRALLNTLLFAV